MTPISNKTTEAWKAELSQGGYEHSCESEDSFRRLQKPGFVWRRMLNRMDLPLGSRIFELGCGGGQYLAQLAVQGYEVHGIDVSPQVVARAQKYLSQVANYKQIQATVEAADIFEYTSDRTYDLCYHFGVVEHFLMPEERRAIWASLFKLTRPGGWVASVVPCGRHFMRTMVREKELAGYKIPEIDYSCALHRTELTEAGFEHIVALPHNYFSFLSYHPLTAVRKIIYPTMYMAGNAVLPWAPFPESWKETCAQSLIVIGQKPKERL
ncbi:bifunctional 3-demethylubiquinone-9 3-methyltransferase/ 2-octaprenyl-6-hydroxy phenol methylase [compost metagenome]